MNRSMWIKKMLCCFLTLAMLTACGGGGGGGGSDTDPTSLTDSSGDTGTATDSDVPGTPSSGGGTDDVNWILCWLVPFFCYLKDGVEQGHDLALTNSLSALKPEMINGKMSLAPAPPDTISADAASAVIVVTAASSDITGNTYVTGYIAGQPVEGKMNTGSDAYLAKYDAGGALVWARRFGSMNSGYGQSVTVNDDGTVTVSIVIIGNNISVTLNSDSMVIGISGTLA